LVFLIESPGGDLITSIESESSGYQFYASDGETFLASFEWEMVECEEASEEVSKEGGVRSLKSLHFTIMLFLISPRRIVINGMP